MTTRENHKRYCSVVLLLIFLSGCLASTPPKELPHAKAKEEPSKVVLAGSVQKVVEGQVEPEDMVDILTERFLFALGSGTFGSLEEIGEGMLISGEGYIKSTSESEKYKLLSGDKLKTPFLVGINSQAKPEEIVYVDEPKSIQEIYKDLSQKYKFFAAIGMGDFEETVTTALKKAPVYGENIVDPKNRARYFHPVKKLKQVSGIFVGIVQTTSSAKEIPGFSRRIFYNNFADSTDASEIQSHTHIAFLDVTGVLPKTEAGQMILPSMPVANIKDVQHLLPQSKIQRVLIMVYPLVEQQEYQGE